MKVATLLVLAALIVAVPASGLYAAIGWSDLEAYWKLDGDLTDSAGSNDGTIVDHDGGGDNTSYAAGFDGTASGAMDFAITTDYVTTAFMSNTLAKSMSLFFSTTTESNYQGFAGSHGGQRFYIGAAVGNGKLVMGLGVGGTSTNVSLAGFTPPGTNTSTDNTYHHVVMVDNGDNTARMYYRSPSDGFHCYYDLAYYGGTSGGAGIFDIGRIDPLHADGLVDDVAVFNRVLTQAEVESIYAAGSVEASMSELPPLPGDANLDQVVNDADASILAAHWQQTGMGWGDGDFNDDQIVNDADASILAANWQESQEGAAPVPEPSTVVGLLALGLAALVAITRRRV